MDDAKKDGAFELSKLSSLTSYHGFFRYFKNTAWMFLEQFLRTLSAIVIGILVARYLGPDQFGLFSYVLVFTGMFRGVVKLGLDGILVRSLVNEPKNNELFLGTAFWLKVIGAILVIAFIGILLSQTNHDQTTKFYILIVSFGFFFQSFEVVQFYFE